MTTDKPEVMLIGPLKPVVVKGLDAVCTVHKVAAAKDPDAFIAAHSHVRAIACSDTACKIPGDLMARFPNLQLVSSFGVGYDHMDVKWAAAHNVVLTNTPDVLTEEVADTALGLLLVHRARISASGAVFARRQMARAQLSAHQGDTAQPHRRHGGHGRHRPGDRAPARRLRRAGGLSHAQAAARRQLSALPEPDRDGARGRYSDGHRAGRPGDTEHDQCRSARRARPRRHFDQHGARLGGRRAGADQGACRTSASWRRASTSSPRSPTSRRS